MTTRKVRCRLLRRSDSNQCPNEIAGQGDEEILLCPKHLFEAWKQFEETVPSEELPRWWRAAKGKGAQS